MKFDTIDASAAPKPATTTGQQAEYDAVAAALLPGKAVKFPYADAKERRSGTLSLRAACKRVSAEFSHQVKVFSRDGFVYGVRAG